MTLNPGKDFHMSKTAVKKKIFKTTPATKRRSKGEVVKQIALGTELKNTKVKEVFEALTAIIAADLSKKGCGEFNFMGLMKLKTANKPATSARKGRNPFTGEEIMIKAKPASRKVRVRALRTLLVFRFTHDLVSRRGRVVFRNNFQQTRWLNSRVRSETCAAKFTSRDASATRVSA